MDEFPHLYQVTAQAGNEGPVDLDSPGLKTLATNPPPQFGGPEGFWSPETLLVGAIANCYILTFKSIARASRFEWHALNCSVEGVLDRVDRVIQFTQFHVKAELHVPAGCDEKKARIMLEKANTHCLITNSLKGSETVDAKVIVVDR